MTSPARVRLRVYGRPPRRPWWLALLLWWGPRRQRPDYYRLSVPRGGRGRPPLALIALARPPVKRRLFRRKRSGGPPLWLAVPTLAAVVAGLWFFFLRPR